MQKSDMEKQHMLVEKAQKLIAQHNTKQGGVTYQRITKKNSVHIPDSQRVQLIQKGNKLINEQKLGEAEKLFKAIGYNEGLKSIARHYADKGNMLAAYLMFKQAEAKEAENIEDKIMQALKIWLQ